MVKTILSDFSWVLLFPEDDQFRGALNGLHAELMEKFGGKYPFFDYFVLNQELLEYYQSFKGKLSCNIFTSGLVQNHPEVRKVLDQLFDHIFSAYELDLTKGSSESYQVIAKKLAKKPADILFIDDNFRFVKAAQEAGLKTILYRDNLDLKARVSEYLENFS